MNKLDVHFLKLTLTLLFIKKCQNVRGAWVAQSVKRPTLDLGSGRDLVVCGIEPRVGLCADSAKPVWDSLSDPPQLALSLSLSQK